ncbi:MAG: hypothetical protein ACTSUL_06375 [Promethearchaeota archaeon]
MKIAFYSYFFTSLIFYLAFKSKIGNRASFFFNSILTSSLVPLFLFAIWYLGPLFLPTLEPLWFELMYSFIILFINGIMAGVLEKSYESVTYDKKARIIIVMLFLASILIYTGFTFKLPYIDVFKLPSL